MIDPACAEEQASQIDVQRIMEMIPHRHPFLMIDKVIDVVANEQATGIKNVSIDEYYFRGHFPSRPVMPGVMVIEALAQTTGILAFSSANVIPTDQTRFYFVGIDKARFRKPVIPGDQLILKATVQRALRGIWKFETMALVGDIEVAHAEMMVAPETGK